VTSLEREHLEAFVRARGGDGGHGDDADRLGSALARVVADAHAAWPDLAVGDAAFVAHLGARAPDDPDRVAALEAMHTRDLYLACALLLGAPGAAERFERLVTPAIRKAVSRVDRSSEFAREVQAELQVALLVGANGTEPKISSYLGRGPLTSWVQVAAIRTGYGLKRKQPKEHTLPDERLLDSPWLNDDPELARIRDECRDAFRAAFSEALASLSDRERNVLRLHLFDGLNIDVLGRMYGVHRATVARWIARAYETLLSHTRKCLQRDLKLSPSDFDSLMRMIRSQLDVSIATILR